MHPRDSGLRLASILLFAAMCIAVPSANAATWHKEMCPRWDSIYPTPEDAGQARLNQFANCKPAKLAYCEPLPLFHTRFNCYGVQPPPCAPLPLFQVQTPGDGLPAFVEGGIEYCGVLDNGNSEKNHGPPCPTCMGAKGNPVNIAVGNKFQREVDFADGGEAALEFARMYNSMTPIGEYEVGSGWSHSWSRSVVMLGNEAHVYRADGKGYTFTLSGSQWVTDADTPEVLEQLSGGGWRLTSRDNEVELYDADGKLTSITSPSGKVTTLVYSDGTSVPPNGELVEGTTTALRLGKLIRVVDFRGRTMQLFYGTKGNIARVVDPAGGNYRYLYDGNGNLASVQAPDGATRTYQYNESAYTSGAYLPHALTGITDEKGTRFAIFKFDTSGRAISSEHAGGVYKYAFTYNTGSTTFVDPLGSSRSSPYSLILGVYQVSGTTQTCAGCGGTSTETYTFDASRNLSSHKDFAGNLTCYTFGGRNLETQRTEGLGGTGTCSARVTTAATRTITTEWHPVWRLPARKAEPLRITTFSYNGDTGVSCAPTGAATTLVCSKTVQATLDADGSQGFAATPDGAARTWSYAYDANGQVLTVDGPRTDVADTTTYAYYTSNDPSGNYQAGDLASVTNAKGQVTQFTQYDGFGRLKKSIDANGMETLLDYWPRGWIKSRKAGSVAAGYETTTYDYDAVGQLTKVTLPDASYVSYTYDAAHRLTDIQDGLANHIHYTLDNMGNRTAENAYDTSGVLARTHSRVMDALNRVWKDIGGTNPATQITQNGYDANGNLTSILDPLGRTTTQEYDARNRLTAVKDPFNGPSNPTTYQYNGLDALTQVTDPTGLSTTYTLNGHGETAVQSSPDTGGTTFTYDAASNLKTKLDARGIQATYTYDELNRITQIAYPDETVTYVYDSCTNGVGRLCSITDNAGTTSYAYDLWGRVTSKSQTVGTLVQTMGYAYNAAGQLATVTTASGHAIAYGYANNRPVSVAVDGTSVLASATYEPFGPIAGWTWGNSAPGATNTHVRSFDKDFRLTHVRSDLPAAGAQALFERQFSWDDQNRITSITDLANAALSASYGYDALDRLASGAQGASSWGYTYNGVGDRLTSSVGGASTTYGLYPGTHRLQSLSGAQSKSYTYDGAGNLASDGTNTWTFAGNNRATQAGTSTFLVNALGQRVKKTTATSATRFVYDEAGRLAGEYADDGTLVEETVWLADLPVATLRPNGTGIDIYYVHADQLGTPRMVTRPSDNQITWRWDNTEPFGSSQPDENPSGLGTFAYNVRFPGQYYDAETATHYNYFRDYDPSIGRYVESDPIGLEGGWNTYAYDAGSPLVHIDPSGLDVQVCYYPRGIGHVGFGMSTPGDWNGSTNGFRPSGGAAYAGAALGQWVPGEVSPDKPESDMQCRTVSADKKQDDCMRKCEARNTKNPGLYHGTGRNCIKYVRSCLSECGLPAGSGFYTGPGSWFNSLK